jgi:S1-C subfamily serine protease
MHEAVNAADAEPPSSPVSPSPPVTTTPEPSAVPNGPNGPNEPNAPAGAGRPAAPARPAWMPRPPAPPDGSPWPPARPAGIPAPDAGRGQQPPSRRRLWGVALASALVGALVAAAVTAAVLVAVDDDDGPARTPITTSEGGMDVQAILEEVEESVVTIETSGATGGAFDGAGTGVVLSGDGLVVTNAHVIAQSGGIRVRTFDGATFDATLVGSEPAADLAVIRVDGASDLAPAALGSSASLVVGEPVIAIGNALNLGGQPSVTTGIVSAVNRTLEGPDGGMLSDLIQTDAAINPGNSGGPLVDSTGAVVGFNTAIIADSQNIGFAIAVDRAKPIIERIQAGGGEITPDTPRLGVTTVGVETVEDEVKDRLGITAEEGAFVYDVLPGSGAEAAGIEQGDVILALDGERITSNERLGELIGDHEPGDRVEVRIEREGEEQTLTAELGRQGP